MTMNMWYVYPVGQPLELVPVNDLCLLMCMFSMGELCAVMGNSVTSLGT